MYTYAVFWNFEFCRLLVNPLDLWSILIKLTAPFPTGVYLFGIGGVANHYIFRTVF